MILELLLASCPQSKVIQDIAAAHEIRQQRFRQEHEDCILCGLCVRMCEEQMVAKAIGFRGRGKDRSIGTPFDITPRVCRTVRRLHLRLPGLRAALHLHRARSRPSAAGAPTSAHPASRKTSSTT
jgi:ferredoxin